METGTGYRCDGCQFGDVSAAKIVLGPFSITISKDSQVK
jgi:hypothetical protein